MTIEDIVDFLGDEVDNHLEKYQYHQIDLKSGNTILIERLMLGDLLTSEKQFIKDYGHTINKEDKAILCIFEDKDSDEEPILVMKNSKNPIYVEKIRYTDDIISANRDLSEAIKDFLNSCLEK